jgi:Flp pilus assembly protein TadD
MEKIEPPDNHYLLAALGWLGLGNAQEARAELAQVRPSRLHHPDVLEVRWAVCAYEKNWPEALSVAEELVQLVPERASGWLHRAYAFRRVPNGGLQQAWDALLPAFEKFPEEAIIAFNLACYACQMGQLKEAQTWLKRAFKAGGKEQMKQMALADPDLEALREKIAEM